MSILTAYKSFRQNLSKRISSQFNKKSYISTTNKTALDEPCLYASQLADNVQQQKDDDLKSTKESNNIMLQVTVVVDAERVSSVDNYNNNNEEMNVRKEYENENMCKRQQKSKKGFCISVCKSFNTFKRYVLAKIMRNGNKQDHSKEEYNNNNKNKIRNNTENLETSSMIIALNNDNNNNNTQVVSVIEECIIYDHLSLITDRDNDSIASSEYTENNEFINEVYIIEKEVEIYVKDDSDNNNDDIFYENDDDYTYNSDSAYNIDVDTFEDDIEFEFVSLCAEREMPQNVTSSIPYGLENVYGEMAVCPMIDQIELDFKKRLEEKLRSEKMAKESHK